ncbi:MAG: hypothetical protein IH623_25470 [Verrucomicrobia bacterium]|nr:hypothetical protein [Verrucomicrobiota bacterium]
MNQRSDQFEIRGWITLSCCFAAFMLQMILNALGRADFNSTLSDPYAPADVSIANRVCLVSEWMAVACLLVWVSSQFRAKHAVLFSSKGSIWMPLIAGTSGLFILVMHWIWWTAQPFSAGRFGAFEGWLFGLGWFLLFWAFVFWRGTKSRNREL